MAKSITELDLQKVPEKSSKIISLDLYLTPDLNISTECSCPICFKPIVEPLLCSLAVSIITNKEFPGYTSYFLENGAKSYEEIN